MTDMMTPRDETAMTGPDPEMENSADLLDKSDYRSEDFADNLSKSLCVHALSSDDEDMGGTEGENQRTAQLNITGKKLAAQQLRQRHFVRR
jgi:hypothetical protein